MRSVREHLAEHYVKSASFKLQVATELSKALDAEDKEEVEKPGSDTWKAARASRKEAFRRVASFFQESAELDRQMKESCEKTAGVDDLEKLAPSNVSGIVDPSRAPSSGVRPVLRAGQREIPSGDMPKVDMQFEHLVKVDD